jgi:hypothetical protein
MDVFADGTHHWFRIPVLGKVHRFHIGQILGYISFLSKIREAGNLPRSDWWEIPKSIIPDPNLLVPAFTENTVSIATH